jgi:hypothetical protein
MIFRGRSKIKRNGRKRGNGPIKKNLRKKLN